MIKVGEEEGAKVQGMTYHVPQGSAREVLREAIPHGGVQSHLPVGMERKSFGSSIPG